MNVLLYMFTDMEFSTTCHLIFTSLIGPVICWFIALIYTVIIGRNRKVNCFVYIITALAILINLLGSSLSGGLSLVLKIMFILILFAAFISFILLCVFHKNQSMKKKVNITMISVYGCAFVYEIIYCCRPWPVWPGPGKAAVRPWGGCAGHGYLQQSGAAGGQ